MEIVAQGKALQVIRLMMLTATPWLFWDITKSRKDHWQHYGQEQKFPEHKTFFVCFSAMAKSIP